MNITKTIITFAFLLSASLTGCQSGAEDCSEATCGPSGDMGDDIETPSMDLSRFEIEIVGEGQVVVNEQSCTTADGICGFDAVPGTVIVLEGDFLFVNETSATQQEGRCYGIEGCRLVLGQDDVRVVADVDVDQVGWRDIERHPFGLLPGQPGIIIDDFQQPFSEFEQSVYQSGPTLNELP